jgi:carboxymethylenebutenolidase
MKRKVVDSIFILVMSASILVLLILGNIQIYAELIPTTNIAAIMNDIATTATVKTDLQNKTVNYYDNASGYLVFPTTISNASKDNKLLPAVIMIHEWWGINDNIKNMANVLAKEGYVVLAADLFKGEVTKDPNRAMQLAQFVRNNPNVAIANLQSAVNYVSSLGNVNASRIASIGWCFGGGQSLQLALNSREHPLAATVIYYGNLVTDKDALSNIKWPVLGIFGDQDQSIPVEIAKQFEQALNEIGITNEIYIYPGVGHAFANPSGDNYAPNETADAWKKTLSFLNKYV